MKTFTGAQFVIEEGSAVVEASHLGLKPGEVLMEFAIDDPTWPDLGTFRLIETVRQDGDVLGWEYENGTGEQVTILND